MLHLAAQVDDRHPTVKVDVAVDETSFGTSVDGAIQRLVREAVNNALKHGTPAHIRVAVRADPARSTLRLWTTAAGCVNLP